MNPMYDIPVKIKTWKDALKVLIRGLALIVVIGLYLKYGG
jgi:hypothetical protein